MVKTRLVLEKVDEALRSFEEQGVKPTLRTIFYWLVSREVIPNTTTSYKGLSAQLVEARKDGRYAWDFLEDKTRVVMGALEDSRFGDGDLDRFKEDLEDKLGELSLEKMLEETFDYMRPWFMVQKWAEQPEICEVWIEKEALAATIEAWLTELTVPIRVNRGYSSWTFIYNNVEALKWALSKHSKITIYYLGDLDPSGVDMQRFLEEAIRYFGLDVSDVELVRLAVTEDQVETFNLPPRPQDMETLAKLQRDTRTRSYTKNYIVELDALVAFAPTEFREIVRAAIKEKWDRSTYDTLRSKAEELRAEADEVLEKIKEQAREKIQDELEGS